MASLSLPRVLQLKKNSVDAEREHFEKFQTLAIQKAINSIETPVKEKHVRRTIIGTFQEQSAVTYWMVAIRQPLQENRIVAWKFCHMTHKLLREGHPACLDDSQRHIGMVENLGKLWVHLREGYGRLINLYCGLLVCKLKFHARNPRFPGNMQVSADELDNIAENDVNNYFQLCVELFDYMDEILNVQEAVFESLGNARANSMTASGQCRLAALIPCAQDSSHMYDCNVRLLFRLHASLPPDTLAGHRERFRQQFKKLSLFYKHASSLQYYRNLLTLPLLPSNPPNFLLQSDFGNYVAPVISIPEQPPDEVDSVGSLIDTSDTFSQATTPEQLDMSEAQSSPSPQPDPILERDRLIDHLQNELKRMRGDASQLVQERNSMLGSMREHCNRIELQLQTVKVELESEREKAQVLSSQTPEMKQKLLETEEKAKTLDEKFQKLKGAYTQLRDEHITLIRQKAEVDKLTAGLRSAAAQHESAKMALQQQLSDRIKDVELLQQSASSSEEIDAYKTQITNLRTEIEHSREKEIELEQLRASMETLQIEHKAATTVQEERLISVNNELKETIESLEKTKKDKEEREIELGRVKQDLVGLREKSGDEYKKAVEEKESALKQIEELTNQHQQEKEEHQLSIDNLTSEISSLQQQLTSVYDELTSKSNVEKFLLAKDEEINNLNHLLEKKTETVLGENTKNEQLQHVLSELEANVKEKAQVIIQLNTNLQEVQTLLKKLEVQFENKKKEHDFEIANLNNKLQQFVDSKDETIKNLQELISEKDNLLVSSQTEAGKISQELSSLADAYGNTKIELEECKTQLVELQKEYDATKNKNQEDLAEKEFEIKKIKNQINDFEQVTTKLNEKNREMEEKYGEEKTVFQNLIKRLKDEYESCSSEFEEYRKSSSEIIAEWNEKYNDLLINNQEQKSVSKNKIEELTNKIETQEISFKIQINQKNKNISEIQEITEQTKAMLFELKESTEKELQKMEQSIVAKEIERQLLEVRLEHTERERLNAECELQDLLQHNNILEADVSAVKKQLEEALNELEKERLKLVQCAGEAALRVTTDAIAALEQANPQDSNQAAAELAAKAFEDLARTSEVKGNEEKLARAAIQAAHNTAQLSAYAGEIRNISTDITLSEKINNECRTMLTATKDCFELLKEGTVRTSTCTDARGLVKAVAASAAAADRLAGGTRNVDDELADMDSAIEQAASQIEELLAATKAGDSGVKLEVNAKILDACTTLMAAVKILVQDARKLQNELGDVKTRQKMYMRNPQWSEGLISAAKAVVFAAKLLVTSADEAVGGSGRVEGVSAAAHEVAGSTAQLVAASRARAAPAAPGLAALTRASRHVAAATGALVAAVRAASALVHEQEALDTSALTLTATRRLEMESKVRSLELESALDAERARLAALRKRHYQLAQHEENGNMTNGK